jgi:hypothetical protein
MSVRKPPLFRKLSQHGERLASSVTEALRRDPPQEMPAGPDGELIWQCSRMTAINKAVELAYQVIPEDEVTRNVAVDPLHAEWIGVRKRLLGLPPPRTCDGARAAAEVMLSNIALDSFAEAVESADVLTWLSRACAEYLAAVPTPAIAPPSVLPGADDELIRLCNQIVANRELEAAAYRANPRDDRARAPITEPLNEEWLQLRDRLRDLGSPSTPKGARAMALLALAERPLDNKGAPMYEDLHLWLAMECAEFVLATVPA